MSALLHHVVDGPADAPVLVMAPSLGTTGVMWAPQVETLARTHRVVRVDLRGHGASPAPAGPWTMADLAADVLAVVDGLGVDAFAYAGLSLGGAVGQRLAHDAPQRLTSLALCCTGALLGEPPVWDDRVARVRAEGMAGIAEATRERWFTAGFAHTPAADAMIAEVAGTDPEAYARACEAIRDFDARPWLSTVDVPTLVLSAEHDPVTPPDVGRALADAVPGASYVLVDSAAHLAAVERPRAVTDALAAHLAAHPAAGG